MVDRPGGRSHSATALSALESRSRRRAGADQEVLVTDHDFAVGPDIDQHSHLVVARHSAGEDSSHSVGAHETRHARKAVQQPARVYLQPGFRGAERRQIVRRADVGLLADVRDGQSRQQVYHRGVPRRRDQRDIFRAEAVFCDELPDQIVEITDNALSQIVLATGVGSVDDPPDDIGTVPYLGVVFPGLAESLPVAEVHQVTDNGRRPDVGGDAHVSAAGLARFNVDNLGKRASVPGHRGDFPVGLAQDFREAPSDFQTHLETLRLDLSPQAVFEPLQVGLIVVECGGREFDVGFPHQRSQRHLAVRKFADFRRLVHVRFEILRRARQARVLGDFDLDIGFDAPFACENMSLMDLFVGEELRGPAAYVARADDHSASPADAVTAAQAVDEDACLSSRRQDRGANAHLNCLVVRQERDFAVSGHYTTARRRGLGGLPVILEIGPQSGGFPRSDEDFPSRIVSQLCRKDGNVAWYYDLVVG